MTLLVAALALTGGPAASAAGPTGSAPPSSAQVAAGLPDDAPLGTRAAVPVGTDPAAYTPQLTAPDGRNGNIGMVRQLVACGPHMYAVGTFTEFTSPADRGRVFVRHNALSFNGRTGRMTAFDPDTDGIVHTIALDPSDCSTAWIGGSFSTVGGRPAHNIAAVDTTTGALKRGFRRDASAAVSTLVHTRGRLLVGGYFTTINGAPRSRLASLDDRTGVPDDYLTLPLTGQYPGLNPTRAWNITLNHAKTQALVTGVFTEVGGVPRQQVFQLDLGWRKATLDGWTSPDFTVRCQAHTPFYVQDATYSVDDRRIFTAATGGDLPGGEPHTGVCDAVTAYRNAPSEQQHLWVNYTGCDTLLSVVADRSSVYVGGHQRWLDNPQGCNGPGPGAVPRSGLGAVDPRTGAATGWNPGRSRGIGADDLTLAFGGLWVASDNQNAVSLCGREYHPGICFLPY